jgi:cytochrome bd-type quinol oxidase subunit 2
MCLWKYVYVCMRGKNVYVCSRVPFVPLLVSVFILLQVHGPWPRAPLSFERCALQCVRLCILLLCVCVYVWVRDSEVQRNLPCGPCPCVYAYTLVLCASILSLCVSVCVTAAVTRVTCS